MGATPEVLAEGRLRPVRLLGEGGMGRVYEAYDRELRGPVALKMLRNVTGDAILRLKTEFRSLRDVRHPNLVRLGELFADGAGCFFTMELVDGVDLLDHVWAGSPLSPRRRAPTTLIAKGPGLDRSAGAWDGDTGRLEVIFDEPRLREALGPIAEGLAALHAVGKVHRDVKPSNIMVDRTGRVVLLDLGLVAELGEPGPTGWIEGTIEYMAPEQAAGASAEPPVDLYAAGAVLYEALTGRPPFVGNPLDVLLEKQAADPIAPSAMFTGIPPDLDELCMALLRRDPSQRPSAREVADGLAGKQGWRRVRSHSRTAPPPTAAPFVGRGAELDELSRAFRDSATRTIAILVQGESGLGKTTLLRRFVHDARAGGGLIFTGRCHAHESVPFRAFDGVADAISRFLVATPPDERGALLPRDVHGLSRLFRVFDRLAPADPGTGTGLDVRTRRRRAFSALHELLGNLARFRPLALIIDDLHWCDADTLLLFEGIFGASPPPLLLIGGLRKVKSPDVAAALAALGVEVRTVALDPLAGGESLDLTRSLLPGRDDEVVARVAEASHGSPLFIEQMAAAIDAGQGYGDTLEQVVWTRIADLEGEVREVLYLVCASGVALDQASIARAAAVQRAAFAGAVAQLEALRLVRTTGARRHDLIEPYHDQVRQAALGSLSPEQTARRHRALADVLERRSAPPWLVFHHWLAAGEPDRAAPHAVAAAVGASDELGARRVARLCRAALDLLPADHPARTPLCRALAVALANAGQGGEAAQWYLTAAAGVAGVESLELRIRASEHLLRSGRVDEAMALLRDVLAAVGVPLPPSPRRALASLMWWRTRVRLRGLRPAPTTAAPSISSEAGLRADICLSAGLTLGIIDFIAGAGLHARGLVEALNLGEPERLALAFAGEAGYSAAEGVGSAARTTELFTLADKAAAEAGSPVATGTVTWNRGAAAFLEGRFRDGVTLSDAAARHFAETCPGRVWEQASAEMFAAWSLAHLGDLDVLAARLEDLERASRWHDDRHTATMTRIGGCVLPTLAADRPDDALTRIDEAMAGWPVRGFHLHHLLELLARSDALLYRGDAGAAWAGLDAAWPAIERSLLLRIQHTRLVALDTRARVALGTGDRGLLGDAEDAARRMLKEAAPWATGLAHARLAAVTDARGGRDSAVAMLRAAIEELAGAELALHAASARLRLVALETPAGLERSGAWADLEARGVRRPDRWIALSTPWRSLAR